MKYRTLPHGNEFISLIGLGSSSLAAAGQQEAVATVRMALQAGVNFFDLAAGDAAAFGIYGEALADCRHQVYLQVHFGADYRSGQYGWTQDPAAIRDSVTWQLQQLKTDYIDFAMIHCVDEDDDLQMALNNGVIDWMCQLKKQGVIRHLGLSTHTPSIAHQLLDRKLIDILMFSINPAYDYQHGDYAIGNVEERAALYRRCEAEGVGISVMKAFCGGQLLNEKTSPFAQAPTRRQCLRYALDRPGVLTVLPGVRDREDLRQILGYLQASDEETDYSVLASLTARQALGVCVYCHHCQPCPAGLDIGLINKYYDLSQAGDALAKDHYHHLTKKASDCLQCGHCDRRCPFHVAQMRRMRQIAETFGE